MHYLLASSHAFTHTSHKQTTQNRELPFPYAIFRFPPTNLVINTCIPFTFTHMHSHSLIICTPIIIPPPIQPQNIIIAPHSTTPHPSPRNHSTHMHPEILCHAITCISLDIFSHHTSSLHHHSLFNPHTLHTNNIHMHSHAFPTQNTLKTVATFAFQDSHLHFQISSFPFYFPAFILHHCSHSTCNSPSFLHTNTLNK